jgi:hypothetical protein
VWWRVITGELGIRSTTGSSQIVYAPSGRPVTLRQQQGDSRWWLGNKLLDDNVQRYRMLRNVG